MIFADRSAFLVFSALIASDAPPPDKGSSLRIAAADPDKCSSIKIILRGHQMIMKCNNTSYIMKCNKLLL